MKLTLFGVGLRRLQGASKQTFIPTEMYQESLGARCVIQSAWVVSGMIVLLPDGMFAGSCRFCQTAVGQE